MRGQESPRGCRPVIISLYLFIYYLDSARLVFWTNKANSYNTYNVTMTFASAVTNPMIRVWNLDGKSVGPMRSQATSSSPTYNLRIHSRLACPLQSPLL